MNLKMTELFLDELKHEAAGTRKALEHVPEGHYDWRPHPKSDAVWISGIAGTRRSGVD